MLPVLFEGERVGDIAGEIVGDIAGEIVGDLFVSSDLNFFSILGSIKVAIVFSSKGTHSTHLSVALIITSSNKLVITLPNQSRFFYIYFLPSARS